MLSGHFSLQELYGEFKEIVSMGVKFNACSLNQAKKITLSPSFVPFLRPFCHCSLKSSVKLLRALARRSASALTQELEVVVLEKPTWEVCFFEPPSHCGKDIP